jgi:hypothetical protein
LKRLSRKLALKVEITNEQIREAWIIHTKRPIRLLRSSNRRNNGCYRNNGFWRQFFFAKLRHNFQRQVTAALRHEIPKNLNAFFSCVRQFCRHSCSWVSCVSAHPSSLNHKVKRIGNALLRGLRFIGHQLGGFLYRSICTFRGVFSSYTTNWWSSLSNIIHAMTKIPKSNRVLRICKAFILRLYPRRAYKHHTQTAAAPIAWCCP